MATREEQDTRRRFADRYGEDRTGVVRLIEQAVIGSDWGANGYTTMRQADHIGAALRLGPGVRLLDLGAGRGWPGLYLAVRTGCPVVLTDVPFEGLRQAKDRAAGGGPHRTGDGGRVQRPSPAVSGRHVRRSVHTDVLC